MEYAEFIKLISSIKPSKNIVSRRRGSEENVKIKIIIPLLQFLGYDVTQDMDFETLGADIVLVDKNSQPVLIIETKAWEQQIMHHLNQCLEYMLKLRAPFIIISSGQHTCLYSSLIDPNSLENVRPIMEFTFNDLLGDKGHSVLEQLKSLIGKENFFNNAELLYKKIAEQLPSNKTINEAKEEFINKCSGFKSIIKTVKITEEDFVKSANEHSKAVYNCLILAKDEFNRIAKENQNVRIRYRSKEIGLEYLLATKPRSKIIGLVGIYPAKAKVAFGLEGWEELKCPIEILQKMKSFPRFLKTKEQVVILINLIETAIKKINNS